MNTGAIFLHSMHYYIFIVAFFEKVIVFRFRVGQRSNEHIRNASHQYIHQRAPRHKA